ncbi:MAG: hypothetical protein ACXAAO_03425 [Candidatus Thorarchaeota archaeon]|jgi:hypothetical protein
MMYREKRNTDLSVGLDARIRISSILPGATGSLINVTGGVMLALALLIPVTFLPGLAILVLPSEVYLIDWIYSQLKPTDKIKLCDLSNEEKGDFSRAEKERNATEDIVLRFAK